MSNKTSRTIATGRLASTDGILYRITVSFSSFICSLPRAPHNNQKKRLENLSSRVKRFGLTGTLVSQVKLQWTLAQSKQAHHRTVKIRSSHRIRRRPTGPVEKALAIKNTLNLVYYKLREQVLQHQNGK